MSTGRWDRFHLVYLNENNSNSNRSCNNKEIMQYNYTNKNLPIFGCFSIRQILASFSSILMSEI